MSVVVVAVLVAFPRALRDLCLGGQHATHVHDVDRVEAPGVRVVADDAARESREAYYFPCFLLKRLAALARIDWRLVKPRAPRLGPEVDDWSARTSQGLRPLTVLLQDAGDDYRFYRDPSLATNLATTTTKRLIETRERRRPANGFSFFWGGILPAGEMGWATRSRDGRVRATTKGWSRSDDAAGGTRRWCAPLLTLGRAILLLSLGAFLGFPCFFQHCAAREMKRPDTKNLPLRKIFCSFSAFHSKGWRGYNPLTGRSLGGCATMPFSPSARQKCRKPLTPRS